MDIRFLAVDGYNLIRRIYEARQVSSAEDMTAVVEAAKNSLQRALNRHAPTHAAVVMEDHDRTWRHLLYKDYKANRSATPQLLLDGLDAFRTAFQSIGVPSCSVPSYEADDVIGTIAAVVSSHGGQVIILSTDKVYLQLLSPYVTAFDHFNERLFDAAYLTDQYGIRVDQYIDYLALVGDKSNNVKGVPGVGPKSAVELLARFDGLDQLLASDVEDGPGRKVKAAAEEALRCRQLVTLKTDVELGQNLKSFRL